MEKGKACVNGVRKGHVGRENREKGLCRGYEIRVYLRMGYDDEFWWVLIG